MLEKFKRIASFSEQRKEWPPKDIDWYYYDNYVAIACGDCRDTIRNLPFVDLILTDPPYGCGVKYGKSYDDSSLKYWKWFLPCLAEVIKAGKTTAFTHNNIGKIVGHDWFCIWDKKGSFGARVGNSPVIAGGCEIIYLYGIHSIGVKGPCLQSILRFSPVGNKVQKKIGREKWKELNTEVHPVPKPKELFLILIKALNPNGGVILDPFMGSGTTLVAAKELGRKCIGIEIEEKYCEIAVKRIKKTPVRIQEKWW